MSDFQNLLLETITDQHLSRNEKQLLQKMLADTQADDAKLAQYRQEAFAVARSSLTGPEAHKILDWLEEVVKVLQRPRPSTAGSTITHEVLFTPGDDCPRRIAKLIQDTRRTLDLCVFTITDDRFTRPILEAHRRGVQVRVITDNEKLLELGSDIQEFAAAGIAVRVDRTEYHMHHKFALFDGVCLLTGSYNWTRGAAVNNHENMLITSEPALCQSYARAFEKLWQSMLPFRG